MKRKSNDCNGCNSTHSDGVLRKSPQVHCLPCINSWTPHQIFHQKKRYDHLHSTQQKPEALGSQIKNPNAHRKLETRPPYWYTQVEAQGPSSKFRKILSPVSCSSLFDTSSVDIRPSARKILQGCLSDSQSESALYLHHPFLPLSVLSVQQPPHLISLANGTYQMEP